jgi:hypothetical protein
VNDRIGWEAAVVVPAHLSWLRRVIWHVSVAHGAFVVLLLVVSWSLGERRRRQVHDGVSVPPGWWVWFAIAAWMGLLLIVATALLVTGHAVLER